MKNTTLLAIIVIAVIGIGVFLAFNSNAGVTGNAISDDNGDSGNVQKVVISVKNYNYYPQTIRVKAGEPVSISLDSSVGGCLRSFTIPELGLAKNLPTPKDTLVFTPTEKGTYRFQCSMNMGYGTLIVE